METLLTTKTIKTLFNQLRSIIIWKKQQSNGPVPKLKLFIYGDRPM